MRWPPAMTVWVPGVAWNGPPGWTNWDTALPGTWCSAVAIAGPVTASEPVTNASPAREIVHRLTMRAPFRSVRRLSRLSAAVSLPAGSWTEGRPAGPPEPGPRFGQVPPRTARASVYAPAARPGRSAGRDRTPDAGWAGGVGRTGPARRTPARPGWPMRRRRRSEEHT